MTRFLLLSYFLAGPMASAAGAQPSSAPVTGFRLSANMPPYPISVGPAGSAPPPVPPGAPSSDAAVEDGVEPAETNPVVEHPDGSVVPVAKTQRLAPNPVAVPVAVEPGDRIEVPGNAAPRRRPRFTMAVGMGISIDSSGLVGSRMASIPAFQVQVGVGDDLVGFELRLFSNQASGRFHQKAETTAGTNGPTTLISDMAVDRLAVDLMVALRPLLSRYADATYWSHRVARSVTVTLGAGAEDDSVGPPSVWRIGPVVGAHVDLPLTRSTDATDLRVRLGVRRMFAGERQLGSVRVSDTQQEITGGLALVF